MYKFSIEFVETSTHETMIRYVLCKSIGNQFVCLSSKKVIKGLKEDVFFQFKPFNNL